jgi:hypothetical protein
MKSLPPYVSIHFLGCLTDSEMYSSFRLVYTSDKVQGQIYVPVVNWTRASRNRP